MHSSKWIWALLCVLGLSMLAVAGQNKFGVADVQKVSFSAPVRVGEALLPAGDYEVRHVMEGDNHIMVFQQVGAKKPAQARVKCSLEPLKGKADQTQKVYVINAANQQVLQALIFRGDTAKHVF